MLCHVHQQEEGSSSRAPELPRDQGREAPLHLPPHTHTPLVLSHTPHQCLLPAHLQVQSFQKQPYWEGGRWFVILGLMVPRPGRYFLLKRHIKGEESAFSPATNPPGVSSSHLQGSSNLAAPWNLLEAFKYPDAQAQSQTTYI